MADLCVYSDLDLTLRIETKWPGEDEGQKSLGKYVILGSYSSFGQPVSNALLCLSPWEGAPDTPSLLYALACHTPGTFPELSTIMALCRLSTCRLEILALIVSLVLPAIFLNKPRLLCGSFLSPPSHLVPGVEHGNACVSTPISLEFCEFFKSRSYFFSSPQCLQASGG